MCTAITYKNGDSYFGRNLDLEYSYNETVTVTPRKFPFHFKKTQSATEHYAIIGMAFVVDNYPLYYDAVNECGLAMAGLNFPGNAVYYEEDSSKINITPFELIPYILSKCVTVEDAEKKLEDMNIVNIPFSEKLTLSPLHWIIADKKRSITVETIADGMKIYENPVGVLTNNPPFNIMKHYLSDYRGLSNQASVNRFAPDIDFPEYCVGMGAVGLPGDYSSVSRFIKASFVKLNSVSGKSEDENVGQFFHFLSSVEMPRGAVHIKDNAYDITVYSSCCNQNKGIYYYTTYGNRQINAVDMHREKLDGKDLSVYTLNDKQNINMQN